MALLSTTELAELTREQGQWCISIFMPTHRKGIETQQDPIRLKDLLRQAEARLQEKGVRGPEGNQLLKPAAGLLDRPDFWQNQSDGLAIFVSPNAFRYFRVPLRFDELVIASHRFYIKPLLPLLSGDGRFFVLALSQQQVRLLQGTRDRIDEIYLDNIPNLPKSLAEALKYDEFEKARQLHTFSGEPGTKYGRTAIFHGQGSAEEDPKTNIRRFFHLVDDGLRLILHNDRAPLVLAGVEFLHPIYREVNSYAHLVDQGIIGSPEILKAGELHTRAWAIVQALFEEPQKNAVEAYERLAGEKDARASSDLRVIVPAAFYGRVGTLLVARDAQQWGKFDPAADRLLVHEHRETGDEDLYDLAVAQSLLNSGSVFSFDPNRMPHHTTAAAVLRY